ncbi:MAG: LPS export ABC transporter periplasmic protein LptC [Candidatus Eisenbacteria bacterium]
MEISAFRYVLVKPVVGLILAGLVVAGACSREEPGDLIEERSEPLPDQVISDFKITETSLGKKDWTMRAEKAYIYEKRNLLEARVIEVNFFSEQGEVRSVLIADYGKINRYSGDMEARGNVVVTGSDGVVLESQSLTWDSATRQIASDDSVKVIRNEDVLTGWGFKGDPDLGSFTILRDMKATIRAGQQDAEGGQPNGHGT